MSGTLPDYVIRPAESVHLQPYACLDTRLYGFFLKGDAPTMQARLVDPILNAPTNGACDYRVLGDLVLVSYALAGKGTSTLPPDSGIGWVPENSMTLWIPLVAVEHELGIAVAQRLVMYPAYICVDNTWSLAAGREAYGFPKGYGPIELPAAGAPPLHFSASTLVMKVYGPDNEGVVAPLLQVDRIAAGSEGEALWADLGDAIAALVAIFSGNSKEFILPGFSLALDLLHLAQAKEVPGVFLKQFRDAADGTKACYQAVVEAGSFVTAFRSAGVLPGTFQATLADYASHPLASDLGFAAGARPLEMAFFADFDFTIGDGTIVWESVRG